MFFPEQDSIHGDCKVSTQYQITLYVINGILYCCNSCIIFKPTYHHVVSEFNVGSRMLQTLQQDKNTRLDIFPLKVNTDIGESISDLLFLVLTCSPAPPPPPLPKKNYVEVILLVPNVQSTEQLHWSPNAHFTARKILNSPHEHET